MAGVIERQTSMRRYADMAIYRYGDVVDMLCGDGLMNSK